MSESRVRHRRLSLVLIAAIGGFSAVGCGTSDEDSALLIDLGDHADPLTDQPGDNLFVIEVFEADRDYQLSELIIEINPFDGATTTLDSFELIEDANDDGQLGVGDQLVGREGAQDQYNEQHSGTLFEVRLYTDEGGSGAARQLADRQWVGDGGLG